MELETIMKTFTAFQNNIDSEHCTRENIKCTVRDIEENARKLVTLLQIIHQNGALKQIPSICEKCKLILVEVKKKYEELSLHLEAGAYYKYYDHWKMVTQKLCFVILLIHFLEAGTLKCREEVASVLDIASNEKDGFHLSIEDYLFGVLILISELARFAVNAVTNGDYEKPIQISHFVTEVHAGFRLLSLKNDNLRKRFDVLKYDVKKIEEVVYDLSIRNLKPKDELGDDV